MSRRVGRSVGGGFTRPLLDRSHTPTTFPLGEVARITGDIHRLMGDRANVAIIQRPYSPHERTTNDEIPRAIWVYLHWGGSDLPENLRDALKFAQPRWSDEPYGTRILVDQLTSSERDQTTSAGLSLELQDNEYDVLVVDLSEQIVRVITEDDARNGRLTNAKHTITFADYLALDFSEREQWKVLGKAGSPA